MIYCGLMSDHRANHFSQLTCFRRGYFPFDYLGVPIFKGRVKCAHFKALADKISSKLAAWKGYTLSYAGRVTLVGSVIYGMI